ncbi:hypothetical protein FRB90_004533 [Tulasnella sp. 427]|nr:hypothetical protein FRB90_004533 [Tulasnella sp. 427]
MTITVTTPIANNTPNVPTTPAAPIFLERPPFPPNDVGDAILLLEVAKNLLEVLLLRVIEMEDVVRALVLVCDVGISDNGRASYNDVCIHQVVANGRRSVVANVGTSATITFKIMSDHLSPDSRILVVASELSTALGLIDKIVSTSPATPNNKYEAIEDLDNEGSIVEWNISNKYYDAKVHFLAKTPSLPPAKPLWPPETDQDKVPAIIYVFSDGELYQERFLSLKSAFDEHEAEITIAARLPCPDGNDDQDETLTEEEISNFFSDHKFEFVDIPANSADGPSPVDPHDTNGLSRVVNALSTVMWPTLIRKPRTAPPGRQDLLLPPQTAESLTKLRDSSVFPDDFTSEKTDGDIDPPLSLFLDADGKLAEKDLEALEAWLDGDLDAPWKGASTRSPMLHSPAPQSSSGFEDDFDEFVSATPSDPQPLPADKADMVPEDIMPSQDEIRLTAQRIFGRSVADQDPSAADDFNFDLTEVLGALQAMKEEVAEITDMDARRKAAARIALGFASGLGLSPNE